MSALGALGRERTVVTGVATARVHRRMVHRIGDEARCRIGVAIAALNAGYRDMRRCGVAGCRRAVVTARAIGIAGLVDIDATSPTREVTGRRRVAGGAVPSTGRHVAGIRCRSLRALRAFARVRTVVAGVAAARAHRRMIHRVADEARCRIGVAIAALDASYRDMRRRGVAGRRRAIAAARAIGIAGLMDVDGTSPACEGRRRRSRGR